MSLAIHQWRRLIGGHPHLVWHPLNWLSCQDIRLGRWLGLCGNAHGQILGYSDNIQSLRRSFWSANLADSLGPQGAICLCWYIGAADASARTLAVLSRLIWSDAAITVVLMRSVALRVLPELTTTARVFMCKWIISPVNFSLVFDQLRAMVSLKLGFTDLEAGGASFWKAGNKPQGWRWAEFLLSLSVSLLGSFLNLLDHLEWNVAQTLVLSAGWIMSVVPDFYFSPPEGQKHVCLCMPHGLCSFHSKGFCAKHLASPFAAFLLILISWAQIS